MSIIIPLIYCGGIFELFPLSSIVTCRGTIFDQDQPVCKTPILATCQNVVDGTKNFKMKKHFNSKQ